MSREKIIKREEIEDWIAARRSRDEKVVFTNGCFDILHAGHVELLEAARELGNCLVVGVNSDASVKRLKGESRPINGEQERAFVLAALQSVSAVCIFEDDTPIPLLEDVRPDIHVKGGDYIADDLPEAATVRQHGGEIVIVPLKDGFSTTGTLEKLRSQKAEGRTAVIIPARYGSTRFPGKPLADLGGKTVIERVVEAALQTQAARPILVATDDERIAAVVENGFDSDLAQAVMTSPNCETGTDRLAQVVREQFAGQLDERLILLNIQGDEPFVQAAHLDALLDAMQDENTRMGTLATPLEAGDTEDTNVVKLVAGQNGDALYFSRLPIPFGRGEEEQSSVPRLRHLGVYAYEANWLLEMAQLPPSPLENIEKLEQLRALENGTPIRVVQVENVVPIAIDTPHDLQKAQEYWQAHR
jgi:3-deoxy-manno-octulosonate cytidylyltransferase (CMP-KDO synthetase)